MDRVIRTLAPVALLLALLPTPARAAERSVRFVGPVGIVRVGDPFTVEVRFTNVGTAINAVELTLRYPPDLLRLDAVGRGGSALVLWPQPPTVDSVTGTVHAVGGTPNGLFASDARMVTLGFTALRVGTATVRWDAERSATYLNDGRGTRVDLPSTPGSIPVVSELTPKIAITSPTHPDPTAWSSVRTAELRWEREPGWQYSYGFELGPGAAPDDKPELDAASATYPDLADGVYTFTIKGRGADGTWSSVTQRTVRVDSTAPDPFTLQHPDPVSVGGANLLAWAPVDATSGIDRSELSVNGRSIGPVENPLRLERSWRGATLTVTVYDRAGNHRSAAWVYPGSPGPSVPWWGWILGVLALSGLGFIALRLRRPR